MICSILFGLLTILCSGKRVPAEVLRQASQKVQVPVGVYVGEGGFDEYEVGSSSGNNIGVICSKQTRDTCAETTDCAWYDHIGEAGVCMIDMSSLPGLPLVDYPIYGMSARRPGLVPDDASFTCADKPLSSYWAREDKRCQVFYICVNGGHQEFLCPNGTIFNQEYFICDWYFNFDCAEAAYLPKVPTASRSRASQKQTSQKKSLQSIVDSNVDAPGIAIYALAIVGGITIIAKAFAKCTRKGEYKAVLETKNSEAI